MKKSLLKSTLVIGAMALAANANAQSFDQDFENGALPEGWTTIVPELPYKGGFDVQTYSANAILKNTANYGINDLGGSYALRSTTGATNAMKGNSDNWFISPATEISAEKSNLSFRLAASASYNAGKTVEQAMKLAVMISTTTNEVSAFTTKLLEVIPENYYTWRQFTVDLSEYVGQTVYIAFLDYGTAGSGAASVYKFIDNIKLTDVKSSDYSLESASTLHGQAELTAPYTVNVANFGINKGKFTACYQIGDAAPVKEEVASNIAAGQSIEYTFKTAPVFAEGQTVTLKTWVEGADDAMEANNTAADKTITTFAKQELPYAVCNNLDDDDYDNDDLVETEFATVTSTSKSKWAYDAVKYNAWIYSLTSNSKTSYIGAGYLYTKKIYSLPAGKVLLTTTGTATLSDNYYEVYIAKYADENMNEYATLVGTSEILRDVTQTQEIDQTTVELNIPEAGDYVLAIRPMTKTKNAQMTIIGYELKEAPFGLSSVLSHEGTELEGATLGRVPAMSTFTVSYSKPSAVAYGVWNIVDNNAANEDEAIIGTGMQKKNNDGTWTVKFYSDQKFYEGHTYTLNLYPYASEEDSWYEASQYAGAIGQYTATFSGSCIPYFYADATLANLSPAEGTIIESVEDGQITLTFTAPVAEVTAEVNQGAFYDAVPATVTKKSNTTFVITIPESVLTTTSGAVNLNCIAVDAEGRRVQGNMSEDEDSYFNWSYPCYLGSPAFTITPADGETVESLSTIRVSYEGGINQSWLTYEKIQVLRDGQPYCEISDEDITFDWDDWTYLDINLPQPALVGGTYQVIFPTLYFSLGEEFDARFSKKQIATYNVEGTIFGGKVIVSAENTATKNDLCNLDVEFKKANSVAISNFGVLGALYDESGEPYAIVWSDASYDNYGTTTINADHAALHFATFEEIKAQGGNPQMAMARIGAFKPATGTASLYICPKSFKIDGQVYNEAIVETFELTGEGTTTGIESVATTTTAPAYDLQGRRVNATAKGNLYIQNGQKVIK